MFADTSDSTLQKTLSGICIVLTLLLLQSSCANYEIKNLAKSDFALVADEFISESRHLVLELMDKLYKRNPDQLHKNPGVTIKARQNQLIQTRQQLLFRELKGIQNIEALELVFDQNFEGDRVFALIVGLGGMLRQAYGYNPELFMFEKLNGIALLASARNVEILVWRLKHERKENGQLFLITSETNGVVDNLSFERLFGKIIILQEMMARIADDSLDRTVTGAVHGVLSTVFIPLPI